jgi:UrcA family protein
MNISAKLTKIAVSCAISCLSVSIVAPMAHAEPARLSVSDIDLNTPQGMAAFNERVTRVANAMCESYSRLRGYDECVAAVRDEAKDNLTDAIQLAKAKAATQTATAATPSPVLLASKNP